MSKAEKFIKKNTKDCSNIIAYSGMIEGSELRYHEWLTPGQARKAVEIAREEELEYIKYQLELRLPETLVYNDVKVERKNFIKDFMQAMKDE